jgi:protein-S-isoprenylcysteine O-methyltransferase Ste14
MSEELLFQILFLIFFGVFAAFRIYYRAKAARIQSVEKHETTQKRGIGWAGVVLSIGILGMFASIIIYLLIPLFVVWFHLPFPALIRWIGVLLLAGSIPLLVWIHRTLGRYYAPELKIQTEHLIISTGPYSRVRHPMYTTFILLTLGIILITANLFVTVFGLLIILMLYPISKHEESMLLDQFGDKYHDYMQRTGRFLPRLRQPKDEI